MVKAINRKNNDLLLKNMAGHKNKFDKTTKQISKHKHKQTKYLDITTINTINYIYNLKISKYSKQQSTPPGFTSFLLNDIRY